MNLHAELSEGCARAPATTPWTGRCCCSRNCPDLLGSHKCKKPNQKKSLKHTPSKQISRKNLKCPDIMNPEPATPLMHGLSHRLFSVDLWAARTRRAARIYSSVSLTAAPTPNPTGWCLYSALPSFAWTFIQHRCSTHHPKSLTWAVSPVQPYQPMHWPLPDPVGFALRKCFDLLIFLCLLPQSPHHSYLSCEENTVFIKALENVSCLIL